MRREEEERVTRCYLVPFLPTMTGSKRLTVTKHGPHLLVCECITQSRVKLILKGRDLASFPGPMFQTRPGNEARERLMKWSLVLRFI